MNPFFHTDFSISDSLKSVRKSVLIYETIIQNGSGKTALVESLDILKHILLGTEISYDEYAGIISEENDTQLATLFLLEKDNLKYRIEYKVTLRTNQKEIFILKIRIMIMMTYWLMQIYLFSQST